LTREPKPDWLEVPETLRAKIAAIIGEPVVAGETVWGGFGPTAAFALTTSSGARHFCKGTHPGNTKEGHAAVLGECENLAAFPELARFGATYRGHADDGDWHLMVLEFAPRAVEVPPWTAIAVDRTMRLVADFHHASPQRAESILHDRWASDLIAKAQNWQTLRKQPVRDGFAALFEDRIAAELWLDTHIEQLIALREKSRHLAGPLGWTHMDIRSDNLVFTTGDRLLLVDWPVLSFGPQLLDVAFFLPSLEGQGGPTCAAGLHLYEGAAKVRFADDDIASAAAVVAGFFASRAGQPEIPGLPRLRWVQKMQLFPALGWLSDCLAIAPPPLPRPYPP
jgi:hypothetical protein